MLAALAAARRRSARRTSTTGARRCAPGRYQEAIAILSKVPATRQRSGSPRSATSSRAYATIGKYDDAETRRAARRRPAKAARELWNTLGEVLLLRGKRAAGGERVRARRRRACVGQPDRGAQSRGAALRSRRARSRDEGVRPASSTSTTARGGANAHERRARRRRRPRSSTSARTIRSCSRMRSRRTTARCRADPTNADARVRLGELFLRKYNFADAQTTFDEVLQTNPTESARAARRGAAARGGRAAGGDSLLRAALDDQSRLRRSARRCTRRC